MICKNSSFGLEKLVFFSHLRSYKKLIDGWIMEKESLQNE